MDFCQTWLMVDSTKLFSLLLAFIQYHRGARKLELVKLFSRKMAQSSPDFADVDYIRELTAKEII